MSVVQALLIGVFAYLGSKRTPWVLGLQVAGKLLGSLLLQG